MFLFRNKIIISEASAHTSGDPNKKKCRKRFETVYKSQNKSKIEMFQKISLEIKIFML